MTPSISKSNRTITEVAFAACTYKRRIQYYIYNVPVGTFRGFVPLQGTGPAVSLERDAPPVAVYGWASMNSPGLVWGRTLSSVQVLILPPSDGWGIQFTSAGTKCVDWAWKKKAGKIG
jgi:hypothetical protein